MQYAIGQCKNTRGTSIRWAMTNTDHRHAPLCGLSHDGRHLIGVLIIQTGVNLVGKQHFWRSKQGARQTHAGGLASRQVMRSTPQINIRAANGVKRGSNAIIRQ